MDDVKKDEEGDKPQENDSQLKHDNDTKKDSQEDQQEERTLINIADQLVEKEGSIDDSENHDQADNETEEGIVEDKLDGEPPKVPTELLIENEDVIDNTNKEGSLNKTEMPVEVVSTDDEVVALLTAMGMGESEAVNLIVGQKEDDEIQKIVLPSIELSENALEQFAVDHEEPVLGFQTIFQRIGDLKDGITTIETEVATTLVNWVQTLREDLIEVRTSIGHHFAVKLKMKMFKKFVEKTYEDILVKEFEHIENRALNELTKRLSENFNNARTNVATAETGLSHSVGEQERIVRSYLTTIEDEANELRDSRMDLIKDIEVKDAQIDRLNEQVRTAGATSELQRELKVKKDELVFLKKQVEEREKERLQLASQITELSALRTALNRRNEEIDSQKSTIQTLRKRVSEFEGKLEAQSHELTTLEQKEQTISSLEDTIGNQRAKILELTEQLDMIKSDLDSKGLRTQKIMEQADSISNLKAEISKLTAKLSTARTEIDLLQELRETVSDRAGRHP